MTETHKVAADGGAVWSGWYEHVRLGEQPLPAGLLALLESRRLFTNVRWQDYTPDDVPDRDDTDHLGRAEASGSSNKTWPWLHAIMVDIDHKARIVEVPFGKYLEVRREVEGGRVEWRNLVLPNAPAWLIPSTQPDHHHLYVAVDWEWKWIEHLLREWVFAGVVEEGYAQVSIKRGFTALRLPWVAKDDAAAALNAHDAEAGLLPAGAF